MKQSNTVWSHYFPFKSVTYTQQYLRSKYEKRGVKEPLSFSYKNGYPFCYYIEHGRKFYEQALSAPYELKPILLFYGAIQLLKATLLIVDERYPQNSEVLAHGLSSRKRKSQHYEFSQDTVLIQKRGLFSYVAHHLFQLSSLEGQKFKMMELLVRLPDLRQLLDQLYQTTIGYPILEIAPGIYGASERLLDDLHMTASRYFQFLKHEIKPLSTQNARAGTLTFQLNKDDLSELTFTLIDSNNTYYLPSIKKSYEPLPEILVHLMLLYNLSMIARYETEWWSELHLHQTSNDLPVIHAFLDLTQRKFPYRVARLLSDPIL
ncbi:hypothetical protein GCM10011391_28630 [Pullulanibacillus camelliae]|uniref:YaaC family protein n=1 Tax=Pullulanibacillus camelliae TaxID=1707096 RepID=A0A8J3DXF8_9BACL|nr:YaaC family protein [Pullulanibacillus camelliae]GGE48115.1 hypothetical protein GCM10011391_28630 [Pullulanibacillus camelliae]